MTPGARYAAAIEVLDAVLAGAASDRALMGWGRAHRFAGSGDREAIADLVHEALRCRRSLSVRGGGPGARAILLALASERGELAAFDGQVHAPPPPSAAEAATLQAAPALSEAEAGDWPDWLTGELHRALGAELGPVMEALRRRAPLDLRANLLCAGREEVQTALAEEGILSEPLAAEPAALRVVTGARRLRRAAAYLDGRVEIQDLASQRVARFAAAQPGETVLDFCAGGGGKTLALAMHMANRGRLFAHDAVEERMKDLPPRAARAGVAVRILTPAALRAENPRCDLVLADVPCSGSGAWRRNPDAKWTLTPARLAELTALQDRVLDAAARQVRPGGRLVHATCSLLEAENGDRVAAFLARHPGWRERARLRLLPPADGDGFFACVLIRDHYSTGG